MSGDPEVPEDKCTDWINDHNQSFLNTGIPSDREIEWLELCIGHQRSGRWLGSEILLQSQLQRTRGDNLLIAKMDRA